MNLCKRIRKRINFDTFLVFIMLLALGIAGWDIFDIDKYVPQREIQCPMIGTIPYEVARVRRVVVKIEVEGVGSGSGVFIRPDLILTAGHIIDMAETSEYYSWLDCWLDDSLDDLEKYDYKKSNESVEFIIICDDGTKLVSTEYYREIGKVDIGFLVVDPNHGLDLPDVMFSDNVIIGETVFTMGSPMGSLFNSVSSGIISALDRKGFSLWDSPLIQTDCPINPGNSGGPLFDLNGDIVGIVVGGYSYADGLSLCVHSKVIYWSLKRFDATRGLKRVIGR